MFESDIKPRIAIIDDDDEAIDIVKLELSDAGYDPFSVDQPILDIDSLVESLFRSVSGVVCDHRLSFGSNTAVSGAEIVARFYDKKIPAILVTQFVDIDYDTSIRKWRNKIPILLDRGKTSALVIKEGFEKCKQELFGELSPDRVAYRSLIRVVEIDKSRKEATVLAIIPTWNPRHVVQFPLSIIPASMRDGIQSDARLLAKTNLDAARAEDLFFIDFETIPSLSDDDDELS